VINHVIERLPGNRDGQIVHVSEVRGAQLTRGLDLIEENLLGWSLGGAPSFDLPLQRAELAVGEAAWEPTLKISEERVGLEARVIFKLVTEFGPNLLERILPGPPGPWSERFTGQPLAAPVLSSRFGVHTHLQSRKRERFSFAEKLAKPDNLGVRGHVGSLLDQEETR